MLVIWAFILIPLLLFVVAFLVEAYMAFARLGNNRADHSYLDATWELTHTLLVVAVALFTNFFSANLRDIAYAAFNGLFLAGAFIVVRALLYIYLFYIRDTAARKRRDWADKLFAWIHVAILGGVALLFVQLIPKLLSIDLVPNTQFLPYMYPGLVLVLALCLLPAISLYRSKR